MIKKTICVDFDGVLNEYDGYEEGDLGEPLTGSKEFIKELRRKYKVVILTSRQKEQVIDWLNNNGFPSMKVTNRKVPAVAYIDDRAIQFNGNYKKVISQLKNFKPYWVKEYYRVYNVVLLKVIFFHLLKKKIIEWVKQVFEPASYGLEPYILPD